MSATPSISQFKRNSNPAAPMSFGATPTAATGLGWMGSLRDLSREHGFEPLRVEGSLPAELRGTLYRTGPSLSTSSTARAGGRKLAEVPLARTTFIHDFIATEKHLVFFAPPVRLNPLSLLFGLATFDGAMRWTPESGTDVIGVPIDDPKRVTRCTIDAFYQ